MDNNNLNDELESWGASGSPAVDAAFANRLESTLRQEMTEPSDSRPALAWIFRPGVLVAAALVVVVGLAFAVRPGGGEAGVANSDSTTNAPSTSTTVESATITSAVLQPTTSSAPATPSNAPTSLPPVTTADTTTTSVATTTTDASTTTATPTTAGPEATTIAPTTTVSAPPLEVSGTQNGRALIITWRIDTVDLDIAGWVLLSEVGAESEVLELSRDPAIRRFDTTIVDIDAVYRLIGRNAAGDVVFDSGEIPISPGG